MAKRLNILFACFTGCVVAALFGLLLMLLFVTPIFAMLSAGAFPTIACRIAGIDDKKQLLKIAVYGAVGWILMFMLQPSISQPLTLRLQRIVEMPLVGYDWHIPASVVSTILALVGAWFAPLNSKTAGQ
jgi:hypothetical protein